ncbi:hypothetical protein JXO52_13630, partial [bacterium]|nr:hypothetical protein [bacterium]
MKKLLACTMFCLLSFVLLGATTADAHSIEFNGVSYDYTDMTTTLTYSVTSGTQPALSHWVLEWCTNGEHVLSITGETEYEYGYDQFTKVTGIKFLTGFDDGETKSYTIVLDGIFPLTTINVGFKAANEYTNTTVLGPYAFCGEYSEIGDYVWVDSDKDGIQDAGESGQSGVTVQLFLKTGGNEYKVGEQTTDGSGGYLFTNLAPGTYYVTFSNLPSGYEFTLQDQGGNDTVDSDANPSTGKTIDITLGENESQLQWDAGIKEKEQFGALQVTKTVDWNGVTPDPDKEFTVQIVGPSYPSG